ncbi:hypothetical protein MPSEU_000168100 [Mayamaea pseudoterrestris]|nr:hypothetical protein MPSEU_000168100 [Mayamaea pseudoterrestris]
MACWGPFQLMMEENSAFDWKCAADNETTNVTTIEAAAATSASTSTSGELCADQTSALLNVNLVAITTQILSPVLGHFIDKCGPKAGIYFLTTCLWTGLALVTIATSRNAPTYENTAALDRLLYVGYCLLALVTWTGDLMIVQVGLYFAGHTRSRVIFSLSAMFDAGGVVYLGLRAITQSSPDVSVTVWIGTFLLLSICVMSGSIYFWNVAVASSDADDEAAKHTEAIESSDGDAAEEQMQATEQGDLPENTSAVQGCHDTELPIEADDGSAAPDTLEQSVTNVPAENMHDYILVSERSVKDQLLSLPFLLLCAFFAIQYTSYQWNVSTMRDFLAYLGDDDYDNRYLKIFTLLLPGGIAVLPLVDAILIHLDFVRAFQCVNALALGYTLVKVCSDSLQVQIAGFVLFVIFSCVMFGVTFSFLPVLLAGNVVGKAAGIMFAVTGLTSLICLPLARLAVQDLGGNFFIPNLVFCALLFPSIVLIYLIGRCMKRENEAKVQRRTSLTSSVR